MEVNLREDEMMSTSTALSLWDRFHNRFKLSTSYSFDGRSEVGHKITIFNLNNTPIILEHCELYWKKHKFGNRTHQEDLGLEDSFNTRIKAHDFITIEFTDQHHFDWGRAAKTNEALYIKLYIAGKKPIEKMIYKFKL